MSVPPAGDVVLYDYWRSSACYRVRIALNLKGVAYRAVPTDLSTGAQKDPAYVALNPQGFVPMLEIDGLRLTQSLAICDYLDARFEPAPLLPRDPAARARVLAMALVIAADTHPIQNLRILHEVEALGGDRAAWARRWIDAGFTALETMAANSGPYLSGDQPGLADICLVPMVANARRFGVAMTGYPRLVAHDAALTALPAFAAAHPDAVAPH